MGAFSLDEQQQRHAANRKTLIVLGSIAVTFYFGIMVIIVLK